MSALAPPGVTRAAAPALTGSAVIVTGTGSGIGAAAGAWVVPVGRRAELLEGAADPVRADATGADPGSAARSAGVTGQVHRQRPLLLGHPATDRQPVYGMTKCAVRYWTQTLAGESPC